MTLKPVVAVPARNEQERLPALLRSLSEQAGLGAPLAVIIVLNNTTDGSAAVLDDAARRWPGLDLTTVDVAFAPDVAHVGSARRLAMNMAVRRCEGDLGAGLILTTDADAVPAPDWVISNLAAIEAGADLVGGRIFGDAGEELQLGTGFMRRAQAHGLYSELCDQLAARIDPITHDPWPRHQDHTGASLAVRASVYQTIGGMDALPFREDLGFVDKAVAAGYRLVHPLSVNVTVSARTIGRAPGGMADCVRNWVQEEIDRVPILVESPDAIERRLRLRAAIRNLLGINSIEAAVILRLLGITPPGSVDTTQSGVAVLLQRYAAADPDAVRTVPADLAITSMRDRIAQFEDAFDAA